MPGSATADLLQKSSLELAVRVMLAFGIALGLSTWLGPHLLEPLLHYYETVVHMLDDRYWIDLALTYQTGHDTFGSDLAILGRAVVMKSLSISAGDIVIALTPGQALKSSTAIGILMQPAIMIVGLLLAWPLGSSKAIPIRAGLGVLMLGIWLFVEIPLSLWVYFQDIPIRAMAPTVIVLETIVSRFLLNGGSLVLGALMAGVALAIESGTNCGSWSAS